MAACTTTYPERAGGWSPRIAEQNAVLMAMQADRRRCFRTPEVFFPRNVDNSRLVKASDPVRSREMRRMAFGAIIVLLLTMVYGMQHFSAQQGSYHVEQEKQTLDQLREENRQLRLAQAELTQPSRIDFMARQLGLAAPQPGQVVHPNAGPDSGTPVIAQVTPPASGLQ